SEGDQHKIVEALEDALERGDMDAVEQLRKDAAAMGGGPTEAMAKFASQLSEFLNPDQLATLDRFMNAGRGAGGANGAPNPNRVRDVITAARRVGLDDAQRDQLREIERDARGGLAELRRAHQRDESELAGRVRDEILQILTAEQQTQFNGILSGDKDAARERLQKPRRKKE
ncbi:MAG: hypothetical protein KDA32_15285, partial [Phycisphaerales bacterium]|nr:hypothetical protein [Phycisphaerales bacterium]